MTYVKEEALGRIADQVVVMLPLSGVPGSLGADSLEAEVRDRGYFAVAGIAGRQ